MKKIMILGASVYQAPLIATAKRLGLYTIVCSVPGDYPGFALADKVYLINTVDKEAILKAAQEEQIDGICTSGTDVAVATIGYVCEKMGLSGMTEASARKATDKAMMKQAFAQGDVSAAAFRRVYSLPEAEAAAKEIGYPVVVKRVDSSGSRGITIVYGPEKLEEAYHNALDRSEKNYVLVEELLRGTEIGVDGVVQEGKLLFLAPHEKFVYNGGKTTIPVGHGFPYDGSPALVDDIACQMQKAVTALGLNNCSVNADVFVSGDKSYIIEMGGRTGATCIPELISMYYGFDFYQVILQNALGLPLSIDEGRKKTPCKAKLLMSPADGTITAIDKAGLLSIQEKKHCIIALDFPVGHAVEKMINGTTRIGHVVSAADTEEELDQLLHQVYRCIEVDGVSLEALWQK